VAQLESKFQKAFKDELRDIFPGCIIFKNDPNEIQGIPDLVMLWKEHWAAFECKASARASHQPNQDYYILLLDGMSFAAFVYPENKDQVLDELQQAFRSRRPARVSERQQLSLDELRR
jgi:hypothetical protein